MAVLSHALLLFASLLAAPIGASADLAVCQSVPTQMQVDHRDHAWAPVLHEISVRTFGSVRMREVPTVRVLGRCVVKTAPENPRPVLFGSFAAQIDDSDDENLASRRVEARAPFARPTAVGAGPTEIYVLRAPIAQLERPPRA